MTRTAQLMTVGEAADALTVSEQTVRRWLREGRLEGVKMGGTRRVRTDSVEALLAGEVGDEAARKFEPLKLSGDPVAVMAARIGLSPRVASLRPDLAEEMEVVGAGEHAARFAREFCRYIEIGEPLPGGPQLGDPFDLVEHERLFFDEALACDAAGRRLFRRAGMLLPRKSRKSTAIAVLSLYMASPADGEQRPRVVQAAASRAQASKLFETAKGFVDDQRFGSIALQELFLTFEQRLECPDTGGQIFRVAAEGSLVHGLDPSFVAADELASFRTPRQREAWRALTTAGGGRRDPFVVFLSAESEGDDNELAAVLARLEQLGDTERDSRRPGFTVLRNETAATIVHRYAIPDEAAIDDLDAYVLANPAPWRTRERLAVDLADPSSDSQTKARLFGNRRAASAISERWISPDAWDAARDTDAEPVPDDEWIPEGATVAVAVDAALTHDTTAVGWAWRSGGIVRIRSHVWSVREGVAYDEFVAGGRLRNELHAEPFVSDVLTRRYRVAVVGYDGRFFEAEANHLSDRGLSVVDIQPQSAAMGDAVQAFADAVSDGTLQHDGDPVLAAHIANTGGKRVPRGHSFSWKLFSIRPELPKDAAIAVLLAHYLVDRAPRNVGWRGV